MPDGGFPPLYETTNIEESSTDNKKRGFVDSKVMSVHNILSDRQKIPFVSLSPRTKVSKINIINDDNNMNTLSYKKLNRRKKTTPNVKKDSKKTTPKVKKSTPKVKKTTSKVKKAPPKVKKTSTKKTNKPSKQKGGYFNLSESSENNTINQLTHIELNDIDSEINFPDEINIIDIN
tara:strand:- start:61 stop:588 length:528 start_codon:yes stop_codon:yes gene_type:complete